MPNILNGERLHSCVLDTNILSAQQLLWFSFTVHFYYAFITVQQLIILVQW